DYRGFVSTACSLVGNMLRRKKPEDPGAPLPEGWEARKIDGRKTVYVNHVTKKTQWKKPSISDSSYGDDLNEINVESRVAPVALSVETMDEPCTTRRSSSSHTPEELPYGWRKDVTKDGETVYVNDIEKITSWDPPVMTAEASKDGAEDRLEHGRRPSTRSSTSSTASYDGNSSNRSGGGGGGGRTQKKTPTTARMDPDRKKTPTTARMKPNPNPTGNSSSSRAAAATAAAAGETTRVVTGNKQSNTTSTSRQ
ncbi:unnamed protein product, partial [Pylaiella littoralis]